MAAVDAPEVAGQRRRILELIDEHGDAVLDRSCRPAHLTGSALVLDPGRRLSLLLFHAKLQKWLQPGGHADGDGDLVRVALREATEETGIEGLAVVPVVADLDIHEVRPPREDPHLHLDVRFVVLTPPDAVVAANHESTGHRWMDLQEVMAVGDDGLCRLALRGFAQLDHPG